jgi:hypothetical protein
MKTKAIYYVYVPEIFEVGNEPEHKLLYKNNPGFPGMIWTGNFSYESLDQHRGFVIWEGETKEVGSEPYSGGISIKSYDHVGEFRQPTEDELSNLLLGKVA